MRSNLMNAQQILCSQVLVNLQINISEIVYYIIDLKTSLFILSFEFISSIYFKTLSG